MEASATLDIATEALFILIKISAPVMLISLAVGLVVALFQALTQIQEMTLTFVPKILAIFLSLILFTPYIVSTLVEYTQRIGTQIANIE